MRGRKPKTEHERKLTGNAGHRPIPTDAVAFEAGAPKVPDWLSAPARVVWRRTIGKLVAARAVTKADEVVVAAYCEAYVGYVDAVQALEQTGGATLVREKRDEAGNVTDTTVLQNPAVFNVHKYREQLLGLAARLGLSPLDRARVRAAGDPEDEADPFAQFDAPPRRPARKKATRKKAAKRSSSS